MSSDTRRVGAALYVVLTWILFWQMLHSLFPPFSPLPSVGGADIGGAVYAVAAGAPQHSAWSACAPRRACERRAAAAGWQVALAAANSRGYGF